MKTPSKVLFCASFLWSSVAFGDAMPSCPPGEKVVMNPVQPGAFHHNGGNCVKDPDYKPQPEPPKMTPEQEALAKKKIMLAELEAKAASIEAKTFAAQAAADKAKGTPDEAASKKAADDLAVQLASVKKEVEDAKKALETPPEKTPEAKPETKTESPKADNKAGGCAISEQSSPSSLFLLLAGLVVFYQRRKRI